MGKEVWHCDTEVQSSQGRRCPRLVFQITLGAYRDTASRRGQGQVSCPAYAPHQQRKRSPSPPPATPLPPLFFTNKSLLIQIRAVDLCPAQQWLPQAAQPTPVSPALAAFVFHREWVLAGIWSVFLITGIAMKCFCLSARAAFCSHPFPAFLGIRGQTARGEIFCSVSLRCFFQ